MATQEELTRIGNMMSEATKLKRDLKDNEGALFGYYLPEVRANELQRIHNDIVDLKRKIRSLSVEIKVFFQEQSYFV